MHRRRFLSLATRGLAAATLAPWLAPAPRAGASSGARALLASSPYVYVSPLLRDGSESTCHAELWFGWIDGAVVVTVSRDRWKARAIRSGRSRARIWVGDHGRWRGVLWNDESFREAPSFEARGEIVADARLLDALLALYETKYPDEIGQWRDRMRSGHADGSRVLVRYVPLDLA